MFQSFTDKLDQIGRLNWTPDQLSFLAIVVAIPIILWMIMRIVTWPWRRKARLRAEAKEQETIDRLRNMERKLSEFEGHVNRISVEEQGINEALQEIASGRVTALSATAEGPLVVGLDAALVRRLDMWLREKGLAIVDSQLARLVQDRMRNLPDMTREQMLSLVDGRAPGLMTAWLDTTTELAEISNATFAVMARDRFADLPDEVKQPIHSKFDSELVGAVEGWTQNRHNAAFNEAASQAFRGLLTERFANMPAELRASLLDKLDKPIIETVEIMIRHGMNGEEVRDAAQKVFQGLLGESGNLDQTVLADLGKKLDQVIAYLVQYRIENGYSDQEIRSHADARLSVLLAERREIQDEKTKAGLSQKLDTVVQNIVNYRIGEGFGDEEVLAHAGGVLNRLLSERNQQLPQASKDAINATLDQKLRQIIEIWLQDPRDNDTFSTAATNAFRGLLDERLKQIPENIRTRIQKLIDNAFQLEAQRMLESLDEDDEVSQTMRIRLRAIATGRSNW